MPADERLTKSEKREQAREEAKRIRDERIIKERRNKKLFKILAIVVPILLIAVAVVAIVLNNKTESKSTELVKPANAVERGVIVGPGFKVLPEVPNKPVASSKTAPAHVAVYQDYICPACKAFETDLKPQIEKVITDGVGVIEYRTVTFLDHLSAGSNYSSRAANASYCVANTYPDKFYDYNTVLYANQPAEMTTGLTNKELTALADSVGATGLEKCITSGTYRPFAADNNEASSRVPVKGTPTIIINGKEWDKQGSFYDAVVKAGAAPAITPASAAPTATPSATATTAAP